MITTDHKDKLVSVTVLGEFTLGDFREIEELVNYKLKFSGPINVFMDLRQMAGATVDMAWEEIRFTRRHAGDFGRVAVLTDSQWVTWSAWLNQAFVSADVQIFDDEAEARAWLEEETA
jgi:hypothetical protein